MNSPWRAQSTQPSSLGFCVCLRSLTAHSGLPTLQALQIGSILLSTLSMSARTLPSAHLFTFHRQSLCLPAGSYFLHTTESPTSQGPTLCRRLISCPHLILSIQVSLGSTHKKEKGPQLSVLGWPTTSEQPNTPVKQGRH